jgi:protein-tyrosine phosphatase
LDVPPNLWPFYGGVFVTVYWISRAKPHRIAIAVRPRGNDWLEHEIKSLSRAGIEVLVSLLTQDESEQLGLSDEERFCGHHGMRFFNLPIADHSVPNETKVRKLLHVLETQVRTGKAVCFHCREGIGRSSMLAALVLANLGWTPESAFEAISESRGFPVPDTLEQEQWVQDFVRRFGE